MCFCCNEAELFQFKEAEDPNMSLAAGPVTPV